MKKQSKLKHKLTMWLATLGFASICGGMAVANNYIKVERADAYKVNDTYNYVEFSAYELNNYVYDDLGTKIDYAFGEDTHFLNNDYIIYNNLHYTYEEYDGEWHCFKNGQTYINFSITDNKFIYTYFNTNDNDYIEGLFEYPIYWYSEWLVNNIQKQITISANDLNTKQYKYLAEQMNNLEISNWNGNYITYNNLQFVYDEFDINEGIYFVNNENTIQLNLDSNLEEYGMWQYLDNQSHTISFTSSITIYSDYIVDNIYAPFDGNDIVPTIATGLGLISNLALEFLNGFTALFWDTTNSVMTTFGIFAFVMLGVAITFSVVKLVLNIIRSNSGV